MFYKCFVCRITAYKWFNERVFKGNERTCIFKCDKCIFNGNEHIFKGNEHIFKGNERIFNGNEQMKVFSMVMNEWTYFQW